MTTIKNKTTKQDVLAFIETLMIIGESTEEQEIIYNKLMDDKSITKRELNSIKVVMEEWE